MTNVLSSRGTSTTAAPRRRRRFRRLFIAAIIVAVLMGFLAWVGLGLLRAARDVKAEATAARDDLSAYRTALQAGDTEKAAAMLAQARGHLRLARHAADTSQVSVGYYLPVARGAVSDLRHLLDSADIVTAAGTQALAMYEEFSNHETGVFHDGRFDLPSLARANTAAVKLTADMKRARHELVAVHGGRLEPGVKEARDTALKQVDDLERTATAVVKVLKVLPDAVGATTPKRYVIAVQNPAELRFSGGAPLSLALATFTKGKLAITNRGQTFDMTNGNRRISWAPVPADPWLHGPKTLTPLVTSTVSADWRTAGEELLRAYAAQFGVRADGAIGLDPLALAEILRVTGPMTAPGYGEITAANLVPLLIHDAYTTEQNPSARHTLNNQLMDLMVQRLMSGGQLMGKGKAMAAAAKGRHFQMYFRDPAVQLQTLQAHLGGSLPVPGTDTGGVYTQNRNASKVDFFQHRAVVQVVQMHPDGSADVTRTITIQNRAPGFSSPTNAVSGYASTISLPRLMTFVPARADRIKATLAGRKVTLHAPREYDRQALWVNTGLPPGGKAVLVLHYHLSSAAVHEGAGLRYTLTVPTQAMVNPEQFTLTVVPPAGWQVVAPTAGPRWQGSQVVDHDLRFAVQMVQK